jgi:hypothetical protein
MVMLYMRRDQQEREIKDKRTAHVMVLLGLAEYPKSVLDHEKIGVQTYVTRHIEAAEYSRPKPSIEGQRRGRGRPAGAKNKIKPDEAQ